MNKKWWKSIASLGRIFLEICLLVGATVLLFFFLQVRTELAKNKQQQKQERLPAEDAVLSDAICAQMRAECGDGWIANNLPHDLRDRVRSFMPSSPKIVKEIALSSSTVVLFEKDYLRNDSYSPATATVWFVDLEDKSLHKAWEGDESECMPADIDLWKKGFSLEQTFRECGPGKGSGPVYSREYFDASGKSLGAMSVGDYEFFGQIKNADIHVRLQINDGCRVVGPIVSSTVMGITVNGKSFSFPRTFSSPCDEIGPSDGYVISEARPEFDGSAFIFHFPTYVVRIPKSGEVVMSAK